MSSKCTKYSQRLQQQPLLLHHFSLELALEATLRQRRARGKTSHYVFGHHRYVTSSQSGRTEHWIIQAHDLRGTTTPLAGIELFSAIIPGYRYPHICLVHGHGRSIYRYTLVLSYHVYTIVVLLLSAWLTEPGILPTVDTEEARSDGRLVKKVLLNNRKFPLSNFGQNIVRS